MRIPFAALLGGLVIIGGITQASATTVTYTFKGTVSSETDGLGLFGGNYVGQTYTDVVTFDLSQASSTMGSDYSSSYNPLFGTSVLTVGDSTNPQKFTDTSQSYRTGELRIEPNYTLFTDIVPYNYYGTVANVTKEVRQYAGGMFGDGLAPGAYALTPAGNGNGFFYEGDGNGNYSDLEFAASQVVIASGAVTAVPLPSSAPLFGAGLLVLGAIGFSCRTGKAAA